MAADHSVPGEFELIRQLREQQTLHPAVRVGIGDDAAVLRATSSRELLVAADMLLEGTHFTLPPLTPRQVGYKALAVNLSDLAAMAAEPVAAFSTVALPRRGSLDLATELHAGLLDAARPFDVTLAGGDTNAWEGPLVISVTVCGLATGDGPILRSGAVPGDRILVTGELGGSLAGHHASFVPRVREALLLREAGPIHAMIDISDGLIADLSHVLTESGVGAVLNAGRIPLSPAARTQADGERTALERALGDGEDFELLLTAAPEAAARLAAVDLGECRLTDIGEIVAGAGCLLEQADGTRVPPPHSGWQHRL